MLSVLIDTMILLSRKCYRHDRKVSESLTLLKIGSAMIFGRTPYLRKLKEFDHWRIFVLVYMIHMIQRVCALRSR